MGGLGPLRSYAEVVTVYQVKISVSVTYHDEYGTVGHFIIRRGQRIPLRGPKDRMLSTEHGATDVTPVNT